MIRIPGDKSISHRALLFSAIARGRSRIRGLLPGADCRATAEALRTLGVSIPTLPGDGSEIVVEGVGIEGLLRRPEGVIDCGNSGTTARLLLGLLSGAGVRVVLTGDASLRSRPMGRVTEPLERAGASFEWLEEPGRLPVRVSGTVVEAIDHASPVASAQVKSALLLSGLAAGVPVTVTEPGRSRDHTERMLRRCGARVTEGWSGDLWQVDLGVERAGEALEPLDLEVPGDPSSAIFPMTLAILGGVRGGRTGASPLELKGIGVNPTRIGALHVLERMGARVERSDEKPTAADSHEPVADLLIHPGALEGTTIEGSVIPSLIDELPILAVAGARAQGRTVIRNAEELRVKESDRIEALVRNFTALGVEVEDFPDGLSIEGSDRALSGQVRGYHDHRIAMAFAVLGALPENRIRIDDPSLVEVSYPDFWDALDRLTGRESVGRPPVVTLDGPAGSGKSSTARAVAEALGARHLDSGALFRAVTLGLLEKGYPETEWGALTLSDIEGLNVGLEAEEGRFRPTIGGRSVGAAIRSARVTERVPRTARIPAVREWLLQLQRRVGRNGGVVVDGRDTGTVVFPDAEVKIFLTATLQERARRRLLQEGEEPSPEGIEAESKRLAQRDHQDENRKIAPLRRPDDAIVIDTTGLDFDDQVRTIVETVRSAGDRG